MTQTKPVKSMAQTRQIMQLVGNNKVMRLINEILANKVAEFHPQIDFGSDLGCRYPSAEKLIEGNPEDIVQVLDSLAASGILNKIYYDRLLRCPQCTSINLRPMTHCPKCGSGNIKRGRILEHMVCKYTGLEEDFILKGKYICPNCYQTLVATESNYRSLGSVSYTHLRAHET